MRSNYKVPGSGSENLAGLLALLSAVFLNLSNTGAAKAEDGCAAESANDSSGVFVDDGFGKALKILGRKEVLLAQAKDDDNPGDDTGSGAPNERHSRGPGHPPGNGLSSPDSRTGGFPRGNGGRPWDKMGPGPLDLTPLNLTPEQKQQIQQIRKDTALKARDLRKTLKDKRTAMRDLMFDPGVSDAKLRERHREVAKLHQKCEDAMFEDFLSIRALLTPEQKKHLPEIKPPFREPPKPEGPKNPGANLLAPDPKGKNLD
jgi:Spy/CpxP family protein refolding chaperone